jgi:Electron transfer DM13
MNRFHLLASLGLILSLTLASCGTVNTQTANETLPITDNQPITNPPGQNPPGQNPPVTGPITLSSGALAEISPGHPTSGTAKLIRLENGNHVLTLEGFQTINGPDVRVWVSETATLTNSALNSSAYTDLGALRSTNGNLKYEIPSSVEVSKIKSIIIWCKLAGIAFGGAVLK